MEWSGAYCFCLVCFFVCLSVVNFDIRYHFWTVRDRDFIFGKRLHIWHAYSTNDSLSNDTKANFIVTLTLTLKLKIAFWTLLPPGDIVFHKHTLILLRENFMKSLFDYNVFMWVRWIFTTTMGFRGYFISVLQKPTWYWQILCQNLVSLWWVCWMAGEQ